MRKLVSLAALALSVVMTGTATARPGPDSGPNPDFNVTVMEAHRSSLNEHYHQFSFDTGLDEGGGRYDWGLRAAYVCGYAEYIVGSQVQFKVQIELLRGYPEPIQVNDNDPHRQPVNGSLGPCGDGVGGPSVNMVHDGSPFNPVGAMLVAYKNGVPIKTLALPAVSPTNEETFFSPGAAPGRAVLWYDEDALGNPIPVARVWLDPVAPGVTVQ